MPRPRTRPSLHSYWSDSNPGLQGPTINLHAVAKPLLKRMYHRQASQFIKKNRNTPLSTTTLEIYSSYFPWTYVSSSTKDMILAELIARSAFEADARAIVDSPVMHYIRQMLGAPDTGARISSCQLIGNLVSHECNKPIITELRLGMRLVALLEHPDLVPDATYALSQVACWSDGAQAVVDAKTVDYILGLLESTSPDIRRWTCRLLVSLLLGDEDFVIECATYALSQIARRPDGAQAIVDAKTLDHVLKCFKSPLPSCREYACALLGCLASHESIVPAVLELKPVMQLRSCLNEEDPRVIGGATYALSRIARRLDGALAIVDENVMDHVLELLESPSSNVQGYACILVGRLASYDLTAPAILEMQPCMQLVAFLCDRDFGVIEWATYALSQIALWPDGAQAVINARTLDHVFTLLESSSPQTVEWTSTLLARLAGHDSTASAVSELFESLRDLRPALARSLRFDE
ncbi:hypothetical protein MVEN_01347600 [Mycena venus]|uniref:ARM repeat-containing protein n=1 Tax=Mycena venus TaxID=2733690 RepID=A0A8H7CWB6_9AGAR|nr:hypothetical protein MVEN_01347600 [Mycena venus]